jgi:hypothetical protein
VRTKRRSSTNAVPLLLLGLVVLAAAAFGAAYLMGQQQSQPQVAASGTPTTLPSVQGRFRLLNQGYDAEVGKTQELLNQARTNLAIAKQNLQQIESMGSGGQFAGPSAQQSVVQWQQSVDIGTRSLAAAKEAATRGSPCKGAGGYGDIVGGTQVLLKDEKGTVIATGALNPGRVLDGSTCEFAFTVPAVPKANFYQFEMTHRGVLAYRYNELAALDWKVEFSLG